jgi:thymidine phosphorylase
VRSVAAAASLEARLRATAQALGLNLSVLRTDGSQPVGYGIGPALEARDVLSVLRNDVDAPRDLRSRALDLAGALLDVAPGALPGKGRTLACTLLDSGVALRKFLAICEAQGGFTEPGTAPHTRPVLANRTGQIQAIDNRRLAKVAKLAGAPGSATAGIDSRVRIGDSIQAGEPLFHVHAQSPGEMEYAFEYASAHPDIFEIGAAQ